MKYELVFLKGKCILLEDEKQVASVSTIDALVNVLNFYRLKLVVT